jgi:hypothetical protein
MTQRKAVEELAKKRGVVLVAPTVTPAPAIDRDPAPARPGWMARVMPVAAPMMAEIKAQLGEFWPAVEANLRRGAGYVVDETTRIAIGSPPVMEWERGKVESRDGFTSMRVRRKATAS